VGDKVCTTCWKWSGGTAQVCPQCGGALVPASAPAETAFRSGGRAIHMQNPPHGAMRPAHRAWLRCFLILSILLVLLFMVFPLPQLGLWGDPGCGFTWGSCTRVLFIGNSYTGVNDLPTTFADLAWAEGHRVDTGALDQGGSTLAEHAAAPATGTMLASEKWNVVVLQEQSEIPSVAWSRLNEMYPAATELVGMIRQRGAEPMFYLTFAHEGGWPQAGLPDYASMQAAVDDGYLGIASELVVPIAPVGDAWQTVVNEQANPNLWQGDGSHPTTNGTYLAACVFYAAIFQQSPVGSTYQDGLSAGETLRLQQAAATTVLSDPAKWGILSLPGGVR